MTNLSTELAGLVDRMDAMKLQCGPRSAEIVQDGIDAITALTRQLADLQDNRDLACRVLAERDAALAQAKLYPAALRRLADYAKLIAETEAKLAAAEAALVAVEAIATDYTLGPDHNLEAARDIARAALATEKAK